MANPNPKLIAALIRASNKLESNSKYQWGHMGSCNCGHLAQELSSLTSAQIHTIAMQRSGDWNDQCDDYCIDSRIPIDILISELLSNGLLLEDLMKLEKLSDENILKNLKGGKRYLVNNKKEDVILYLRSWADLLEQEWLLKASIPNLSIEENEFVS
jgi:hypothetical protein